MSTDYLKRILTSKVYDVAVESPLEPAPLLSQRLSNTVLLKREDTQAVFSLKLRGPTTRCQPAARRAQPRRDRGLGRQPCARRGAGGHAAGLPRGHRHAHHQPAGEGGRVRRLGGEVVLAGESFSDAYAHAQVLEKKES